MKKIIIIMYDIFLLLITIFSYIFIDSNLIYLRSYYSGLAFSNRLLTAILYVSSVVVFFVFYILFIYLGVKKKINSKEIFMLLGMTVIILFFSYPAMLSYDIFNYIATSKALFFYHENPYIIMPVEFVGDPLLLFMHAANKVALYGPSWILLSGIPFLFGFGNFIIILFEFKLFIAAFYFAAICVIWKMSKNILSIILFSLNPLVIIETLIGGHNDIVMIFFTLLSFFFLTKKKVFFAILFFILSLLIKYATILLLPIFLYALWKIFKRKKIDWKNIFYSSALLMIMGFLLSPIREEIYPWYAIWFLPFVFLVPEKKILVYLSIFFSFGLLFRYVPYMLSGTHGGLTPILKSLVTFAPAFLTALYLIYRRIWGKIYPQ
jgi:hypothetical protein